MTDIERELQLVKVLDAKEDDINERFTALFETVIDWFADDPHGWQTFLDTLAIRLE